ncbi:MAG TPA: hypothetical protein VMU99_04640 [Acidimicrobiales bacterium]|nr:hypothetical protein [Acidimicrobiales bacterium]
MTDPSSNAEEIVELLAQDPYFRDWTDASRMFNRKDIDEAIALVIGTSTSVLPPLPGAQERAMARLALFQVVAHHLEATPTSWATLFESLSADELKEVEEILGAMSLGELLE